MSTTITGKLNKAARQFQAGESIGFGIGLGEKYRDPQTKLDEWTNYQAVIFAKAPRQIEFYQQALVEGAIVQVTAEKLKINQFDGNSGPVITIDMLNAQLGFVHNPQGQAKQAPPQGYAPQQQAPRQAPPQQQPSPQQHAPKNHAQQQQQNYQTQPQQAPQQGYAPVPDFDDDIPFNRG